MKKRRQRRPHRFIKEKNLFTTQTLWHDARQCGPVWGHWIQATSDNGRQSHVLIVPNGMTMHRQSKFWKVLAKRLRLEWWSYLSGDCPPATPNKSRYYGSELPSNSPGCRPPVIVHHDLHTGTLMDSPPWTWEKP